MAKLLALVLSVALCACLFSAVRFGCDREMVYAVKSVNIDSTNTPGATVSRAAHKEVVEAARADVCAAAAWFLAVAGVLLAALVGLATRAFVAAPPAPARQETGHRPAEADAGPSAGEG